MLKLKIAFLKGYNTSPELNKPIVDINDKHIWPSEKLAEFAIDGKPLINIAFSDKENVRHFWADNNVYVCPSGDVVETTLKYFIANLKQLSYDNITDLGGQFSTIWRAIFEYAKVAEGISNSIYVVCYES